MPRSAYRRAYRMDAVEARKLLIGLSQRVNNPRSADNISQKMLLAHVTSASRDTTQEPTHGRSTSPI